MIAMAKRLLADRGGEDFEHSTTTGEHGHTKVWCKRGTCTPPTVVVIVNHVARNTLLGTQSKLLVKHDDAKFPLHRSQCCEKCSKPTVLIVCKEKVSPTQATLTAAESKFGIAIQLMSASPKDNKYFHFNAMCGVAMTELVHLNPQKYTIYRKNEDKPVQKPEILPLLDTSDPLSRHFALCDGSVLALEYGPGAELAGEINPYCGICLVPTEYRYVVTRT